MPTTEYILVASALLLLTSVLASRATGRLGIPAVLLFLAVGMLAGSEGVGGIYFDDAQLAQSLGVTALAFILFSGGLDTRWQAVRPVLVRSLLLATLGVLITTLLVGFFVASILQIDLVHGLLLGAIVSSTDAAAVFATLRAKNISLRPELSSLLEMESSSNDPMAVFLTVGLTLLSSSPGTSPLDLARLFVQQMAIGGLLGYLLGWLTVQVVNRLRLQYDGLYPVFTLSAVLLIYGLTASAGGSGFLAVFLAGVVVGNREFIHKKSLLRFHDGMAWLMQIVMFLTLGLLVFPSQLVLVAGTGLIVSLYLMLVARPISVFLSLLFARMRLAEKVMVGWVGLRGAAPIILATFPLLAGVPEAHIFFNLVFFIVLTSVVLQGTTIPFVTRWLRVEIPLSDQAGQRPLDCLPLDEISDELVEMTISPDSSLIGKRIVDLGLPPNLLIVLITRQGGAFVPNGSSVLEANDRLLVLGSPNALYELSRLAGIPGDQGSISDGRMPGRAGISGSGRTT